jgi:squalene synthase HpnC
LIHAFYNFVRAADDIADSAVLAPADKLAGLDALEAGLTRGGGANEAATLRDELAARGLSNTHALDLLKAFRLDVEKTRYADWSELIAYCALSAMPVGRFVLDVHGEDRATWPASDAVCAALQIVNHLQDCAEDYRDIDRVYIPLDMLAARGARVEDLGGIRSTPGLRDCVADCAKRVEGLLAEGASLAPRLRDGRLSMEIAVIHALASRLTKTLATRDPLSEQTRMGKFDAARVSLGAAFSTIAVRLLGRGSTISAST